jgi:CBS-domain-containing membrane protein
MGKVKESLARMEQKQPRRVVVIDNDRRCVGIVAQAGLARLLPREKAGEVVRGVSPPGA